MILNLTGYEEQVGAFQCPNWLCKKELDPLKDFIGVGEYPADTIGRQYKPNRVFGLGFRCSECGTMSIYNLDRNGIEEYLQMALDCFESNLLKQEAL